MKDAKGVTMDPRMLDVRGWGVKGPDGNDLGKVDRILLDTAEKKPRYLSVKHEKRGGSLLLPVGVGTPDQVLKEVKVDQIKSEMVRAIPVLAGDTVNHDFERHVYSAVTGRTAQTLSAREWYSDPVFNVERLMQDKKQSTLS
jgi:hypothetical protein